MHTTNVVLEELSKLPYSPSLRPSPWNPITYFWGAEPSSTGRNKHLKLHKDSASEHDLPSHFITGNRECTLIITRSLGKHSTQISHLLQEGGFVQISAVLLQSMGRLCAIPGNFPSILSLKSIIHNPIKQFFITQTPFWPSFLSVPQAIFKQAPPCSLTKWENLFPPPPVHTCTSPSTNSPHTLLCFSVLIKSPRFWLGLLLAALILLILPSFLACRTQAPQFSVTAPQCFISRLQSWECPICLFVDNAQDCRLFLSAGNLAPSVSKSSRKA